MKRKSRENRHEKVGEEVNILGKGFFHQSTKNYLIWIKKKRETFNSTRKIEGLKIAEAGERVQ